MKIRTQMILGISVTFLIILGIVYVSLQSTVLGGIEKIEVNNNEKALTGMRALLTSNTADLLGSNKDWSNWDETYYYMTTLDPIFIENNLMQSTYDHLKIDAVLLMDTSGKVVYAKGSESYPQIDLDATVALVENSVTMKAQNEDWSVSGYLNMDGRLIEVAASAILDSNSQGPLHGTLVFTHELTDEDITGFAVSSGGTYRFVTTSDATQGQQYSEGLWLKPVTIDTFIGVIELPLLDESSKGYLEATLPRPIYLEGLRLNSVLLLTLIGVFILASFTAVYVTDMTLLHKIDEIGSKLTTMKPSEEMTHMPNIENNELNTIVKGVNTLIDEVETSKTKLKEQERLVAMGKVASMVGHDLRNPLQVLTSTSYMIKKKQEKWGTHLTDEENQTLAKYLATIDDQTSYMDKIVSDIQYYSKDFKPQTKPSDIMEIVRSTITTIRIPETISVAVGPSAELPKVDADSQLIQRVFTNLIINAIQAMPHSGALIITGERVGKFVRVCIKDTGVGMTPELLSKIFTPFFTTKAKGSGLGLAAGKRIIDAHGGTITVESTLGQGSCFCITLPVSKNA